MTENFEEETKVIETSQEETGDTLTSKMRENPWILATFVLGILTLILFVVNMGGMTGGAIGITGAVVSEGNIQKSLVDFASSQGADLEVVSIKDDGVLYEVLASIEGDSFPIYVTKDGRYLISGLIPLEEATQTTTPTTQTPTTSSYSSEELEKLKEFNQCLANKGFKVYGAEWCGYCKQVVTTLGGYDIASPVYVECEDANNKAVCAENVETGYPTIKLNGQAYQGARTLEAFAQATGCSIPF